MIVELSTTYQIEAEQPWIGFLQLPQGHAVSDVSSSRGEAFRHERYGLFLGETFPLESVYGRLGLHS